VDFRLAFPVPVSLTSGLGWHDTIEGAAGRTTTAAPSLRSDHEYSLLFENREAQTHQFANSGRFGLEAVRETIFHQVMVHFISELYQLLVWHRRWSFHHGELLTPSNR
jgi:hypothetical protein